MKKHSQATIDFIDKNIAEIISLDNIADYFGSFKCYLNQVFKVYTGYSVMIYARLKKPECKEMNTFNCRMISYSN